MPGNIVNLINNLWRYIFQFVDLNTLLVIPLVCKRFNMLVSDLSIWKRVVQLNVESNISSNLYYAEKFIDNPYKKFIIANKRSSLNDQFTLVSSKVFFIPNISYKIWFLLKQDTDIFVLLTLNKDNNHRRAIRNYCGYINENGLITRHGNISSLDFVYEGDLDQGYLHGNGKLIFHGLPACNYIGNFSYNYIKGEGIHEFSFGFYHSKQWKKNAPVKGLLVYKYGGYYEGEFDKFYRTKGTYCSKYGTITRGNISDRERYKTNMNQNINNSTNNYCEIIDPSKHSINMLPSGQITGESVESFKKKFNPSIIKCIEQNICTRAFTKKNQYVQEFYCCLTCNITKNFICETCINTCHKGHQILSATATTTSNSNFFCECHNKGLCYCYEFNKDYTDLFDNMVEEKIYYHELLPDKYKTN